MKIKLHQRRGILDHKPKFSKTLTDPGELFSLVVGHWAMFSESPQQTFENFALPTKAAILEFWIMSGWIVGTPRCWDISKTVKEKVCTCGGGVPRHTERVEIISLYHLVNQYRDLLKIKPSTIPNNGNVSALMRRLCKEYPSVFVQQAIVQMFQSHYPDYSIAQLKNVLESRFQSKKKALLASANARQSLPGARRAI